jgi:hypothetical protein
MQKSLKFLALVLCSMLAPFPVLCFLQNPFLQDPIIT